MAPCFRGTRFETPEDFSNLSLFSMYHRKFLSKEHRPIEGFIHQLKLLECQGYGRATFDLLRTRALAA
jgi:hypothetical protein